MDTILIVEDAKNIAKFEAKRIKEILDLPVEVAYTMAEAIEIAQIKGEEILVALLDLCLPDAPHGEVVDEMLSRGIPSIVFTAEVNQDVRETMMNKGLVDYVLKSRPAHFDYAVRTIEIMHKNRGVKVLVVDDSGVQRTILRRMLDRLRFEVLEAGDGEEALQVFKEHGELIKMVITDENMPGMNGVELVERLRLKRFFDSLTIIGMSSYGNSNLIVDFLKRGANDFLIKPFTNEEFMCRILQSLNTLNIIQEKQAQATTDFLTGLANRRYYMSMGEKLFENAKRKNLTLTIGIADIDFFKKVNDTYGHDVGDRALVHVSNILYSSMRKTDVVGRLGGEEFGLLCVNMDLAYAMTVFERIRKKVERAPIPIDNGEDIFVTISIGVACSSDFDTLEEMMKAADEQLYTAKENGRNQVVALY